MSPALIDELNSDHYIAIARLQLLMAEGALSPEEIDLILALKNTLVISDFLEKYQHFSEENLPVIHRYIISKLDDEERLFVSDLIEFAEYWDLELPYKKCIDYLSKYDDDHSFVQLAVIDYIYSNFKMNYIDVITKALDDILWNAECEQSVQVNAAFVLLRVTHKKKYLVDLLDLVVNGDNNKTQLKNMLSRKCNSSEYFEYHDVLNSVL